MPSARSEGLGVDDDVAIASKDHIIPRMVAIRQRTVSKRATAPIQIIQRVTRVRGAAIDASPAWYGFVCIVVIHRFAVATERIAIYVGTGGADMDRALNFVALRRDDLGRNFEACRLEGF